MSRENEGWEMIHKPTFQASAQAAQDSLKRGRLRKALGFTTDCVGTYILRWPSNNVTESSSLRTKDDLQPYSTMTAEILYDVLHGTIDLPCHCQRPGESLKISQHHIVTLGLGILDTIEEKTHRYFDSLLTLDETHRWTCVQFRLPAFEKSIGIVKKSVKFDDSVPEDIPLRLDDFCQLARERTPMYRNPILLHKRTSELVWYEPTPIPMENFPANRGPVTVTEALERGLLSAESKVRLAFAISKYFWQFYDSKWMQVDWNLDDALLLLPQKDDFQDLNAEAGVPYLAIRPTQLPLNDKEYDVNLLQSGARRMHQHPFILKLCLFLVLLGTENGSMDEHTADSNLIHGFCARKILHKETNWPNLTSLRSELNERYRKIVSKCLPTKPRNEMRKSVEERRDLLKDEVVEPLYGLLQGMKSVDARVAKARTGPSQTVQTNNLDLTNFSRLQTEQFEQIPCQTDSPRSKSSEAWLHNLNQSVLHTSLTLAYGGLAKRPKIALIDTGYDPKSFLGNKRKKRLGSNHWKDFAHGSRYPLDEDGHGTSMLDLLMRVAPFADICVARIARLSQDLGGPNSGASQKRLAEAIEWATKTHQADIVSLSLGWEYEQSTEKRWIANAISRALDARDQKVLFFAAASNLGGGNHELFPARHPGVFSIRSTNHRGKHQDFNPSLPEDIGINVYGTVGVGVPTIGKHGAQAISPKTGTSPATAIAAGIAATVIAYINTTEHNGSWDDIKTHSGFQKLLHYLSTETEARKRFITLQEVCHDPKSLKRKLEQAT